MKRILVIEDNDFIYKAYQVRLSNSNFKFEIATNGKEGLGKVASFKPHLIILDLMMPIMDGFEVLKNLKANKEWQDIPVVVASSMGKDEDIEKAKSLGAVDYIYKEEVTLIDTLERLKGWMKKPSGK